MTGFISDLGVALSAEILKTKRTLALRLAVLAPLLVALLEFLILWRLGAKAGRSGPGIWISLTQNSLLLWDLLMVPLFVTLQTALLAGLEHSNKGWKHLFALPVSRRAIYGAKQLVALALIGISTTVLWAAVIGAGLLLRVFKPGIGFESAIPVWRILWFVLLSYACSWLIIAIHTWVAMRSSSFVVAIGFGVAATVVAVIVLQSDYNIYYPWTLPAVVTRFAIVEGELRYLAFGAGLIGGIALAVVGTLDFSRRDVM
jgi:hypothetical protein